MAELESILSQAQMEGEQHAAREKQLKADIEVLSKAAIEQINRLTEAETRVNALEEARLKAEAKTRQRTEREQRLSAELEAARESKAAQVQRIAEARAESRRLAKQEADLKD